MIRLFAELSGHSSYHHAWACGDNQRRARADETLRPKLRAVFAATRQSYGYPRMTVELRAQGEQVGKARVARLLREEGLQGRQRGGFRPRTTDSNHDGPIAPNRLAQAGAITACDQMWQTDITYLPTRVCWLYLAVVIDAHSKRVLGWAFSASLETGFVIAALLMAIRRRGDRCAPGLLLHSDRRVQYSSERFRAQLAAHRITASMSRRGDCYDNARAESFFSTLKIELVYRHDLLDRDHARSLDGGTDVAIAAFATEVAAENPAMPEAKRALEALFADENAPGPVKAAHFVHGASQPGESADLRMSRLQVRQDMQFAADTLRRSF